MNQRVDDVAIAEGAEASYTIAHAIVVPEGYTTITLPLSALDPITRIHEETFYQFVKKSIEDHGMYHPLVIHPITIEDWKVELELDKFQTPPPMDEDPMRLRVQTGCNRFFALQELGYDACECIVMEDLQEARDLGFVMSRDKKWQRAANIVLIKERNDAV